MFAISEFDTFLNSNSISKGCLELPDNGLWWCKPELQRCYNKALKNSKIVLLEILLVLLITLCSTHGVVKAKRDVGPSHIGMGSKIHGSLPSLLSPSDSQGGQT